jgi:Cation transport ATPase
MVLVLVVLGQYLDARARQRASEALTVEVRSAVRSARVVRGGSEIEIAPEDVVCDEAVRVRSGEEIPVDGVICEGTSYLHDPAAWNMSTRSSR